MTLCLQPECLTVNPSNHKFCQKCGKKLLLVERYRAVKKIGEGGFGKTFQAIDQLKFNSTCVIKQFAPQAQGTSNIEKAAELFAEEAARLNELGKHLQIPELFAYFQQDNQQYLVQEFIEGENLLEELETKGTFNESQIRTLLIDILKVLKFVHENKVIHRDIKPENIIRRNSDQKLVLVDFGASKVVSQTSLSVTGTIIGSAQYTSPEQAAGKPKYASDLYSLGVSCLQLLTGVSPFDLYSFSEADWVWRDYLANNPVSDGLGQILDKLVESAVKRRYQAADEVLKVLTPSVSNYQPKSLNIPSPQGQKPPVKKPTSTQIQTPKNIPQLKTFNFETVKITEVKKIFWGRNKVKTKTIPQSAQYFRENLGNGVTLDMIYIPSGTFSSGTFEPFFMAKYPVTQAQWQAIASRKDLKVKKDLKPNPAYFKGNNRPVEEVSWYDAVEFCERLSRLTGKEYRLPTEAQWEYACRADTETPFYFGETITTDLANYNGSTYGDEPEGVRRGETTPVGQFPPNAFGLYDMHGNVWEWSEDTWRTSKHVVLCGGSFDSNPAYCRSAYRYVINARASINHNGGFRVVCVLPSTY